MLTVIKILLLLISVAWWIAIAHIAMSWLINFGVLNLRQPIVAQIWDGLNRLLNPIYGRIRGFLPNTGALDLAPLIFLLGLLILQIILRDLAVSVAL